MTNDDLEPLISSEEPQATSFSERFAHFLTRTSTVYATAPLSILADRGIENRLFDSLLAFIPEGCIIAGGFVTQVIVEEKNASDIDLFFTSEAAFRATVALLMNPPTEEEGWAWRDYKPKDGVVFDLDKLGDARFITFVHPTRPALQLLRMVWYDSAEHVIDTFDLTVVQFAATGNSFVYNPVSWLDLSRKRICLHRMQFPASTLRRLIKYAHKGFYACPGSLVKICEAIQAFQGEPDVNDVVYVD